MFFQHVRFLLLAALALALNAPAHSQPGEVRVTGVVRDATGAALAGATITVTPQPNGASRTATSSSDDTSVCW